ncbi:hypothetical protein ACETRX_07630 [Labrys portucalensis]|uniref:DUF3329 domain-containing protein n=1 Tax=Labrys neptuniae TaxID=376174 RepID=A0ABV6ZBB0_9HYPH|nr:MULTISPECIES: DUF3329 domain-containing protein [Labrys]MBP0578722.1 DUF3329 domain-containing protein [Labrys sp. LIt4]MDT3379289.1 hypothetical protein [Labrys neptuniae]
MAQPNTPNWMRPLWVRVLLCVLPAAWAGVELYNGNQFWGLMFAAVAAYGLWTQVIQYRPPEE